MTNLPESQSELRNSLMELPAYHAARHWHAGQFRKGRNQEAYIHHPLRVALCLAQHGIRDPELLSAALLHDVLEDTECPPEELAEAFGPRVLGWIREVSDPKELLKAERKQRQVERADLLSMEASWIRIADKIDNLSCLSADPPQGWNLQRQREYLFWCIRVTRPLMGRIPPLDKAFAQCCLNNSAGLQLPELWVKRMLSHRAVSPEDSRSSRAAAHSA